MMVVLLWFWWAWRIHRGRIPRGYPRFFVSLLLLHAVSLDRGTVSAFYLPIASLPSYSPAYSGVGGDGDGIERTGEALVGSARLRLWDGREVQWWTGEVVALIETSVAVRFSSRGIHFYNHDVFPYSDGFECRRNRDALCTLAADGNRVFPSFSSDHGPPRYYYGGFGGGHGDGTGGGAGGEAFLREPMRSAAFTGCALEASGGRVVVGNASVYDLSPCDLANVDVLWTRGKLHVDHTLRLPLWAYGATGCAVLFLVMSLGQNLGSILGDPDASPLPVFTETVCLVQCVGLLALNDPYRVWVAEHDRAMLGVTLAYTAMYLFRHAFDMYMQEHVHTLNVITATLILVTARLYCSFETPYATVFLLLLMTRMAHKLFMGSRIRGLERFTVVADALYMALHYSLSFRPGFFDPQIAPVYLLAMAVVCLGIGAITHSIEKEAAEAARQPECVGAGGVVLCKNGDAVAFGADGRDPWHHLGLKLFER